MENKDNKIIMCLPKCPECGSTLHVDDLVKGTFSCWECYTDYTDNSTPEERLEYLENVVTSFLEFLEQQFPTAGTDCWPSIYNGTAEACWYQEGRCGDLYWKKEKISIKDLFNSQKSTGEN